MINNAQVHEQADVNKLIGCWSCSVNNNPRARVMLLLALFFEVNYLKIIIQNPETYSFKSHQVVIISTSVNSVIAFTAHQLWASVRAR